MRRALVAWGGLLGGLVLLAALAGGTGTRAGAPWNDAGPEGHERLVDALSRETHVRILDASLGLLPADSGPGDVLFAFPGYRSWTPREIDDARGFVERGGVLVLAGDGTNAVPIVEALGIRFQSVPALLPPGTNATCIPVSVAWKGSTYDACLPSPAALPDLPKPLSGGDGFLAVANSSVPLFLDLDGDGSLSLGDQGPAPYPLAFTWERGRGTVVAISDADLWRNGALDAAPHNLALARALAAQARVVYVDSTADDRPGVDAASDALHRWTGAPGPLQAAALLLWAAVVALPLALSPRARAWRPHADAGPFQDEALERDAQRRVEQVESPSDSSPR